MSTIRWNREFPRAWERTRLKYICLFIGGGTPDTSNPEYWDGDIPWVSPKDMKAFRIYDTKERLSFEGLRASSAKLVKTGAVLLVMRSGILQHSIPVAINEVPVALNQDMRALIPCNKVERRFLARIIEGHQQQLLEAWSKEGATVESLESMWVGDTEISLPFVVQQQEIADFLDRKTSELDALVLKKRTLIEKLKEKRSALISRTVTRGLPPVAAKATGLNPHPKLKKSGIEWLGDVPEHWETPALGWRFRIDLGKMLNEQRITGDRLVPYLRNVDIQWNSINFDDLPEMDISERECGRYTIKPGDLLVCEGGEVGRCAIVPDFRGIYGFQKALHRIRSRSQSDSLEFLFYVLLCASNRGVFIAGGNPNTIDHLTGEKLRGHRFPRPPKPEQLAITDFLNRETGKIDALITKIEEAIERLQEYRAALITAAVTGKVDVRREAAGISSRGSDAANTKNVQVGAGR